MKLVIYNEAVSRPLPFYLALEEFLARPERNDDYFFMWQVDPTVIIGRNQLLEKEINTAFCRENGIRIVRRRSGGGAVFADRNNIMFSYITSSAGGVKEVFSDYTSRVATLLRQLGLDASDSSRNDVMIGDRKVSGNAFYHVGQRSIVHGTMLFDTDRAMMAGALTPSDAKLESKGVASVRSRITTLREHLPDLTIGEFKRFVTDNLCDGEPYVLSANDEADVEKLSLPYFDSAWTNGRNPSATISRTMHVEGVGEIGANLTTARGRIISVDLTGDFFTESDPAPLLESLKGVELTREALHNAMVATDPGRYIRNLTNEKLIDLIIWKN